MSPADGVDDARQDVEGCDRAIELAAAVVGDDDAVDAVPAAPARPLPG